MTKCDRCKAKAKHLNRMGFAYYGTENAPYICHKCCRDWEKVYIKKLDHPNKFEWVKTFEEWMKDTKIKVIFT